MPLKHWFAVATACAVSLSACNGCNRPATKPPPKAEGEACTTDIDCETGLCFALKGEGLKCKRKCSAGCKKDTEVCTQIDLNKYGCVPAKEGLCKACESNSDCPYPADICISVAGVKVCGRDCSFDSQCPESYHCVTAKTAEGAEVLGQCVPVSNTCACTSTSIGQVLTCQNSSDAGTCLGSRTCMIDGYSACTAKVPTAEVCNGMDDDCDTMVDENLGDTMCGVGECKKAVSNCVNGMPQTCVPGAPTLEICNDKDDDCNGTVDDGIDKMSLTHCGMCNNTCTAANGTPKCMAGSCQVDTCTAPFKDCDGVYSNGCETNTNTSLAHCGACAKPCTAANATPSCTTGACTFVCNMGFGDLDGNPMNGCEATCTTTDAPETMFQDTNCDGIDGIEANAIFVDTLTGLDTNAGTKMAPKKTIGAGITAANAANPKKAVYVSQGIYSETVTLQSGVSLYGGYNAANGWARGLGNLTLILSSTSVGVIGNNLLLPTTVQLFTINAAAATGTSGGAGLSSYGVRINDSPGGVTLANLTISAGNGSAGLDGSNGSTGAVGQPGTDASGSTHGSGGSSPCGATGGLGADGVNGVASGQTGGTGTVVGGGGTAAAGGNPGAPGSCSLTSSSNGGNAPPVASNGGTGPAAMGGTPPTGIGALNASALYLPVTGGTGATGGTGGPGGGGGSGGGTARGTNIVCSNCSNLASGGGGGGGGGGCGGLGGGGGRGGGGSFGVAINNSVVTVSTVTITTGNGAKGGDGGDGGGGGLGGGVGNGAAGQSGQSSPCNARTAGAGANGSSGGQGGQGGGGAGGSGGPSICVFYKGFAPATSGISCTTGTVGQGGAGGNGFQQAPSGPAGTSGTVIASN